MDEVIVTREELINMFESEDIVDTGKGWIMHDNFIDIVALHEIDPKFLQDITKAKTYKIITKGKS
ncbi:MAG: hypothetical protein HRT41_13880 [Campylobacteraceae bacterium]|nr:hypothetical protein [Campylobacteraceae bacterium]